MIFRMVELMPIERNMDISEFDDKTVKANIELSMEHYQRTGFSKPWISYLITYQDNYAGICAFKSVPIENKVEIAYHTFPLYEGKGLATEACKKLIEIAQNDDKNIAITARTLPETNASTNVLTKNSFKLSGTVIDLDDGEVFEWALAVIVKT